MTVDLNKLSRVVSLALRHEPWRFELEIDDEGWTPTAALLASLRSEDTDWSSLSETDLERMIDRSEKRRHEMRDGRIRALYGHSTPHRLIMKPAEPPDLLYHGTSPESAQQIALEGLKPMGRQYVHLSVDKVLARQVGTRKARLPIILAVRSADAFRNGVAFYLGNDQVWLADEVPAAFVSFPTHRE